jgi:hypothetical protein
MSAKTMDCGAGWRPTCLPIHSEVRWSHPIHPYWTNCRACFEISFHDCRPPKLRMISPDRILPDETKPERERRVFRSFAADAATRGLLISLETIESQARVRQVRGRQHREDRQTVSHVKPMRF